MNLFKKFWDLLEPSNQTKFIIIGTLLGALLGTAGLIFNFFKPSAPPQVIIAQRESDFSDDKSDPISYGSVAVNNIIAVSLPIIPNTAQQAHITLETNSIRFRVDGIDPTASDGHLLEVGDNVFFKNRKSLTQFKAIAVGKPATIRVTYYKSIK